MRGWAVMTVICSASGNANTISRARASIARPDANGPSARSRSMSGLAPSNNLSGTSSRVPLTAHRARRSTPPIAGACVRRHEQRDVIAALRVRHLEIEGHAAQKRLLAPFLEIAGHVERQPIRARHQWGVEQVADAAVRIGLARALGIGALGGGSLEAPQRHGDAGGGLATRGIEDVR